LKTDIRESVSKGGSKIIKLNEVIPAKKKLSNKLKKVGGDKTGRKGEEEKLSNIF
jgi:hypothetical protein